MKRKFLEYEYWPYWLFYTPFVPYWFMKSLQAGSFSYFCKVNPGIQFGGALDYSKYALLKQIPKEFKPLTEFIPSKSKYKDLPAFPFVVKPDFGERGVNVELIRSLEDWENYTIDKNIIVQNYVEYPFEFGVFFVKKEGSEVGEIISITGKEFLVFQSDGKTTLKDFVENHPRAFSRKTYLNQKFYSVWNEILPEGEIILLEPIGNHNRGTRFFDASHLISQMLLKKTSFIASHIEGFNYGRFDVKATSEAEFLKGNFLILEINGSSSEPTHIYDSKFNLWQAYKEVKRHLDIQFAISKTQPKTYSSTLFYKALLKRIFF